MLEKLVVHGKVYEPILDVAEATGVLLEEMIQLAEARVIAGAWIEDQWFIDSTSVIAYLELSKQARRARFQMMQKISRAESLRAVYKENLKIKPATQPMVVLLQSSVIMVCGLLVGLLMYNVQLYGLEVSNLQAGALDAFMSLKTGLSPVKTVWESYYGFFTSFNNSLQATVISWYE